MGQGSAPRPAALRCGLRAGLGPLADTLADHLDGGAALLVEGEDLQLGGEVDLAQGDALRHLQMGGAKFRIEATPAATRRSQTSWAAQAGVATTPMATCSSLTTRSRSSMCSIASRPMRSPTLAGSESSRATMRKPRSSKPR